MDNKDKDFNVMLKNNKDMPKIITITDKASIEKYGGSRMYLAPPAFYDELMKKVPFGKLVTIGMLREKLARLAGADFTDPMTAGIFVNIAAWASSQRNTDETPYWRTLKANGELSAKYPGKVEAQAEKLRAEGHTITARGRKNLRYFVENYENSLKEI